jgi:hypothetical protein
LECLPASLTIFPLESTISDPLVDQGHEPSFWLIDITGDPTANPTKNTAIIEDTCMTGTDRYFGEIL